MTTAAAPTLTTWTIDPSHSHVEFSVRHLMIANTKGRFGLVEGTIQLDDADPAKSTAEVRIDAASIDTRDPQRDAHLRSADFFDVERFPHLTFRSTAITDVRGTQFKLAGDLTIHGVTRPVVFNVTQEGRGRDPWGNEKAAYSATAGIKRSEFGLTWNQALEAGGVLVGDEVKISLDLELVRG
jgi:polyisoprenoid-binding protein YceI